MKTQNENKTGYGFSITRTTSNGVLEYYTSKGWRSEKSMIDNNIEKLTFLKEEAYQKLKELKKDCRISSLAKSMIVNY